MYWRKRNFSLPESGTPFTERVSHNGNNPHFYTFLCPTLLHIRHFFVFFQRWLHRKDETA